MKAAVNKQRVIVNEQPKRKMKECWEKETFIFQLILIDAFTSFVYKEPGYID